MKRTLTLSIVILLAACGGSGQQSSQTDAEVRTPLLETPESFRAGLSELLDHYFLVKDALVQTNPGEAATAAAALLRHTEAYHPDGLNEGTLAFWDAEKSAIVAASGLIAAESDVEEQRLHFESLSNGFINLLETIGPLENAVYRQTCPMVRGGSADWLSASDQVMNPYHGSRMLRCGSVVSRL